MKKKYLLTLGGLLFLLCAAVLLLCGRNYTVRLGQPYVTDEACRHPELFRVELRGTDSAVALTDTKFANDGLTMSFRWLKQGKSGVEVLYAEEPLLYFRLYAHPFGIITYENYFGDCTGDIVIPVALILYLAAILLALVRRYRANLRRSIYQYRNVMVLGLIIFLSFLLLNQVRQLFSYQGVLHSVNSFLGSVHSFSVLVLPVAFVLSVLITISNIDLMRKEGRNWRNMLGTFLGIGLCLLTLAPGALGEYLQWSPNALVDVHNESGAWLYVETFTESSVSMLVTYLECILLGTVILGVKAARHVPPFDRDYLLILGCQIRDDGTLPPLLRSRADRAVEFARQQKEAAGKDLVFVPSGGQGPDEVMAEADAIRNYLLSLGIPEDRILAENTSVNTEENIRNSMRLIREHSREEAPKVAFSTTNYHVFRAGMIAQEQGESLEGIGSPTKRYFWVNAFVREFIATLAAERKKHIAIIALLTVAIIGMVVIKYLSVVI